MKYLERFYEKAYDWILVFGPKLIISIIMLIVGFWLIRVLIRYLKKVFERKDVEPTLRSFLQNLIAVILQVLLIVMVMQTLGIEATVFAALVAAFGVAAGLALSGTMQNFASGILILLLKPFKVGDNIVAQGQQGTVSGIQIFHTTITTYDNRTVIIPNSKLSNEVIVNLSKEGIRRIDLELKFKNNIKFDVVQKIIEKTISEIPAVPDDHPPRIGMSSIDADGFTVSVNVWTEAHGFVDTTQQLNEKIHSDLRNAGMPLAGM